VDGSASSDVLDAQQWHRFQEIASSFEQSWLRADSLTGPPPLSAFLPPLGDPLRLAVLLHRGRSPTALPQIDLAATPRSLELRFPARWLKEHPLTFADLQLEVDYLRMSGAFRLRVFSRGR